MTCASTSHLFRDKSDWFIMSFVLYITNNLVCWYWSGECYFLESKNCHAHLDFLHEHDFGFWPDFLHQHLLEIHCSSFVKRNESRPVWVFLFIISLQFTCSDKRFFANFLSALEAFILVRWSNIASKSARFFRSRINLIALSILGFKKRNVLLLSVSCLLNAMLCSLESLLYCIEYARKIPEKYINREIYQRNV